MDKDLMLKFTKDSITPCLSRWIIFHNKSVPDTLVGVLKEAENWMKENKFISIQPQSKAVDFFSGRHEDIGRYVREMVFGIKDITPLFITLGDATLESMSKNITNDMCKVTPELWCNDGGLVLQRLINA